MLSGKRGQGFFFLLMVGLVFFLLGLALAPALQEITQEQMDSSFLNCSDSSITQPTKAVCTSIDMMTFLFTGVIFGLGGVLITRAVY